MKTSEPLIRRIVETINDAIPTDLENMGKDAQANLKIVLAESLGKMNLVSHEEFEIQSRVLTRTRTRLESLEKRLDELETQLAKTET